jgi:hypothetical protein
MTKEIDIYFKKTNKGYKTNYGVPFQCVELIRRFFSTVKNVSFPDVVDAVDLFERINTLSHPSGKTVKLITFQYPYSNQASYYLRPGTILFWKRRNPIFKYGHVALILDSDDGETTVIQQNLNPPIKKYDTRELFAKMNASDSKFLGVKTVPFKLGEISCNVLRI